MNQYLLFYIFVCTILLRAFSDLKPLIDTLAAYCLSRTLRVAASSFILVTKNPDAYKNFR